MPSVGDDLDWTQRFLLDRGALWPRAELLRYYREGYLQLLALSHGVRRFLILEAPPQVTAATSRPRAPRPDGGTERQFTLSGVTGSGVFTSRWEVEQAEGIPPAPGLKAVTQLHYQVSQLETHYLFALPRAHERIAGIWFDHKGLTALSVTELDQLQTDWWNEAGDPVHWTPGVGETRAFEVYPLPKTAQPGYRPQGRYPWGFARTVSGARTYTWVTEPAGGDPTAPPLGLMRRLRSPERQYLSRDWWFLPLGLQRQWLSSVGQLLIWETVVPDVPALEEASVPALTPRQLTKYLKYYVLAQAFNRQGEGFQGTLAQHWQQRWQRGVRLLQRVTDLTWADVHYQRLPGDTGRRDLPLGRLPGAYPRLRL